MRSTTTTANNAAAAAAAAAAATTTNTATTAITAHHHHCANTGELEGMMGQLQQRLSELLRDAVACKNRGNALVSPTRGAPTASDWEAAGMECV